MLVRYMLWPCVCLSVSISLSQVRVLLKQLNMRSCKQHQTIAQVIYFSDAKDLTKILRDHPQWGHQMQLGYVKIDDF